MANANRKLVTRTTSTPGGFNALRQALIEARVVRPPVGAAVVRLPNGQFGPGVVRVVSKKEALPSK